MIGRPDVRVNRTITTSTVRDNGDNSRGGVAMKFDAIAFLESLFQRAELTPADLPGDWHILWDERAAMMEYDGEIPRERAEALALAEVLELMRTANPEPGR